MEKMKINAAGRLKTSIKASTVPRTLPGESQGIHQLLRAMVTDESRDIPEEIRSVPGFANVLRAYKDLAEACVAFCKEIEMPDDHEMVQGYRRDAACFTFRLASLQKQSEQQSK